jgi:predicted nucleotidyltransferase
MLSVDFREFLKLLNENKVNYLIIGGYAVSFHGHPRYTKDIDIWVENNKENATKILKALGEFGFSSVELAIDDFLDDDNVIQLGFPPNRIDLLTGLEGVTFRECFGSKIEIDIDDMKIAVIGLEDLKKIKRISGRHQDLADIENLEE